MSLSKNRIKKIREKARKEEKRLKKKIKEERKTVKELEKSLDQVLKNQDLETELKDIESESASIVEQLPALPTPPAPSTSTAPFLPTPPTVSSSASTPASTLALLRFASRQAQDLAISEGLTVSQLAGLTPSGTRGAITVRDIRSIIPVSSSSQ